MPKPNAHDRMLERYPSLKGISASEWGEVFDRDGHGWTTDEEEYLREWMGRETLILDHMEEVIDISYALGRTPDSVYNKAWRMRQAGIEVRSVRKESKHEGNENAGTLSGESPANNDSRSRRGIT